MTSPTNFWGHYKTHVARTLGNFGDQTPVVLTFGLSSEIGELFGVTQLEIIHGKQMTKERISEIGDVLWYISAIELFYGLPNVRYSNYFGIPFEINNAHGINLVATHAEMLHFSSEVSRAMISGNVDDIHYYLNKILAMLFDVCAVYGINAVSCLQASINKLAARHPSGYNKDAKKRFQEEYKADKITIRSKNEKEILLNIKLNKKAKVQYRGIQVKVDGTVTFFNTGDIVVDFFDASNYIAKTYQDIPHRINYSPLFREALNETTRTIFTGYIVGEKLVTAKEMRARLARNDGNTVFLDKGQGRPILMTPSLKTLNNLLDYCSARRKVLKKKESHPVK